MWAEYFVRAHIYGFDWSPAPELNNPRITTIRGDVTNSDNLRHLLDVTGMVSVLIDDCGHTMQEQQTALGYLFEHGVEDKGLYVVEDLVTSYTKPINPRCNWNPTATKWTTLAILQALQAGKPFESEFMLEHEITYLREHIEYVNIERGRRSEIAFIRKQVCQN